MARAQAIPGLDAATYQRHPLHAEPMVWVEKNCYIDVWIELLHALGLDPLPALAFTLAIDFEGDQWTFFKPSHQELWQLYGIDVQEMNVWRPLIDHAVEHLTAGKLISTEADAYWLPDTAGTDYRAAHTKSTIILNDIDVEARRLGYFHNASYYALNGEDFNKLFRLDAPPDPAFMPLFAEQVRIDRMVHRSEPDLAQLSIRMLESTVQRLPRANPVTAFSERLMSEFQVMPGKGLNYYHAWAFANTRQLGAAFEVGGLFLAWIQHHGMPNVEAAVAAATRLSAACKTLILRGARSATTGKTQGIEDLLRSMAADWQVVTDCLRALHPQQA
jgi:Domain of unknown function (DUF1839)